MEIPPNVPIVDIKYRIFKSTGHSGKYIPENILVDNPSDQSSRWSSPTQVPGSRQWLLLELERPSILRRITFGKFFKQHPCNMKDFSVAIGRSTDSMTTVLTGVLSNTPTPESFDIPSPSKVHYDVPVCYIKIIPSSAHSPGFHVSIWHVSLLGISDTVVVNDKADVYDKYRETIALRHVLKYLRRRRHFTAFESLLSRTGVLFEHPTTTSLYDKLMLGDWSSVESLLDSAAKDGLFNEYLKNLAPKATWTQLDGANMDGDVPCARGGHQMCIDVEAAIIYLFGGWDGEKNLDDFWSYSIKDGRWCLLTSSTRSDGGPRPASCHKMAFDSTTGYIYVFGRLPSGEEGNGRSSESAMDVDDFTEADFYRYSTRGINVGTWTLLSQNTFLESGPHLLHDHQMVVDSDAQSVYMFGGSIVNARTDARSKFSGLFKYDIRANKWSELMLDQSDTQIETHTTIPGRYGHSMLLDPKRQELIILAGRIGEALLSDIYTYHVRSQTVRQVTKDFSSMGGPDACFCQRAALDPETGDIYVLPGLLKSKIVKSSLSDGTLRTAFWIFKPNSLKWIECVPAHLTCLTSDSISENLEPPPRYAHQMVYDYVRKQFFIHGGNAGGHTRKRLDDFWQVKLQWPSPDDVVKQMKFIIRQQRFKELCHTVAPVEALTYLQKDVHSVVDHSSEEETSKFRALHSHLFFNTSSPSSVNTLLTNTGATQSDAQVINNTDIRASELQPDDAEGEPYAKLSPKAFYERTKVFESLMEFIKVDGKEPDKDLIDLLTGSENGAHVMVG